MKKKKEKKSFLYNIQFYDPVPSHKVFAKGSIVHKTMSEQSILKESNP